MSSVDRPTTADGARARRSSSATRALILKAARERLLNDGYARLSTRGVAATAEVPLSQLHYHFGSKQQLVLDLLKEEDARRLDRQTHMYGQDRPLWQRYEQACDFLEEDLKSGYVRVLQEMIAAGWSDRVIAKRVKEVLRSWLELLVDVTRQAEATLGRLGPFAPEELAALVGQAFLGGESLLLLGFDRRHWPVRAALRGIGRAIRQLEEARIEP